VVENGQMSVGSGHKVSIYGHPHKIVTGIRFGPFKVSADASGITGGWGREVGMSLRVCVALVIGLSAGCGDVSSQRPPDGGTDGVVSSTSSGTNRSDGGKDAAASTTSSDANHSDGTSSIAWCAKLQTCCGGFYSPSDCSEITTAGDETFCSEVLWAIESDEESEGAGQTTDYCQSSFVTGCVQLCGGETPYGAPSPSINPPSCKAMLDCCSQVTVPGGSSACSVIAEQGWLSPCNAALGDLQERGFCK
jgi:hypothetical protein